MRQKNANSMAVSVLGCEKPLVGAGEAISLVLSVNGPKKHCIASNSSV